MLPPENFENLGAFSCYLVHYFTQNTAAETGTLLIGNDNSYLGSRTGGRAPPAPPLDPPLATVFISKLAERQVIMMTIWTQENAGI